MSDTPKSDALKDRYAMHGIDWYELCRELERENAALKKQLKDMTDQFFAVSAENAALREDKARLDSIKHGWRFSCEEESVGYPDNWFIWPEDWSKPLGSGPDIRAAIDAARKEAQP